MLTEPWRAASSRARISAARASGDSVGRCGGGRGEVAVAAVRRLARDAERPRDVGERAPACSARRDVDALELVELARAARSGCASAVGRLGSGERALEQRDDPLRVGGHALTTRETAKVGYYPTLSDGRCVEDLCDMTAVPATLRLRREGALRSRAARGDAAAFAAVYERHHQALYRYCRSILRHEEDAQDALQSTMTRAFAALQDEQRDFELRPWLFRIAHNEAISILRRRRETGELGRRCRRPASWRTGSREREELRLLQLDLADLPERQRAALVLRELNGLSHAEIGVVLELSTGAVKQAIFDARTRALQLPRGA